MGDPQRIYSHDVLIRHLLKDAERVRLLLPELQDPEDSEAARFAVVCLEATATLLEVHDATGINLTQFGPVEDFVNAILAKHGFEPVHDNGA